MARPMTAADRAPQVGDVLRYRNARREVEDSWYSAKRYGWLYATSREYTSDHRPASHVYVSRADGGPVAVEED